MRNCLDSKKAKNAKHKDFIHRIFKGSLYEARNKYNRINLFHGNTYVRYVCVYVHVYEDIQHEIKSFIKQACAKF